MPQSTIIEENTVTSLAHDLDEQEIAQLAYELWQSRGCPEGSPEEDWFRAVEELQSRESQPMMAKAVNS